MNFLKRAQMSIFRQPFKFIILLVLVFILSTVASGAISITNATRNTETNLRRQMRPIVVFEPDGEGVMAAYDATGEWPILMPLTSELIRQIATLPQVDYYHYAVISHFEIQFAEYLPDGAFSGGGSSCVLNQATDSCYENLIMEDITRTTLRGTSGDVPLEMREGLIELVAGHDFGTAQPVSPIAYPVLVSSGFASINGFSIGSTFTLDSRIQRGHDLVDWSNLDLTWDDILFDERHHEFEIVGLFDVVAMETDDEQLESGRQQELANRLFTTNEAAESIQNFEIETQIAAAEEAEEALWFDPENWNFEMEITIMLVDPLELESFELAVAAYLPEFWAIHDLTGSFDQISGILTSLTGIADGVLLGAAVATTLIFTLLIFLFLRDRQKEIGIYLALGEQKSKIIFQMLTEVMSIAFIGITLSIFAGSVISTQLSQEMIRTELTRPEPRDPMADFGGNHTVEGWQQLGFDHQLSVEDMINAFDATLKIETILLLYGIAFGTIMVSTLIPMVYVVKLEPKKVLL